MSAAIKSIVDGYVRLQDRNALEELRAHRQKLRRLLEDQPKSWVDVSKSTQLLNEDLQEIEAGLTRL